MKEEDIKIEELSSIDLIKLIYKEIKNTKTELDEKIDNVCKELSLKMDNIYKELEQKIDNVHRELNEKYHELNQKIQANCKYLEEKIDNTKNTLVIEISDELKGISTTTTKLINDLEKKINNEINDRKLDVSKVKDFNKIILNDIGSRVSILEEESEKYTRN